MGQVRSKEERKGRSQCREARESPGRAGPGDVDLLLLGAALGEEEEGVCVSPVGTGDCLASPALPRAFCSLQTSP